MKRGIFLLMCLGLLTACADDKKDERPGEPVSEGADTVPRDFNRDAIDVDRDNTETEDETPRALQDPAGYDLAGDYRKTGEDSHPLEVSFTTPTELCIVRDKMYIAARFVKTGSNTADVYLVEPTNIENADTDLPWEDFDRDTPVATVELLPDGSLELDWKGFTIDGELVTEYALLGKKEMEGTYERV